MGKLIFVAQVVTFVAQNTFFVAQICVDIQLLCFFVATNFVPQMLIRVMHKTIFVAHERANIKLYATITCVVALIVLSR